jgi:uncharacterized protein (UPF0248 family)
MEAKSRTKLLTTTLILLLSASLFMVVFSTTTAQQTPLRAKTYPFIFAVPNPVGVGEEVLFAVGIESAVANVKSGWEGLSMTIEKPDGKVDKIENIKTDSTGSTGVRYVPNMVGTYYCTMSFPEQAIKYASFGTLPLGTIMLASTTDKYELVVTEDPAPKYPGHALPQEYWTRPIHTDLREWSTVAGNWLQWTNFNRLAPGNAEAPETPHILWTKEFQMGGLVGAPLGEHAVEDGAAYQTKFTNVVALGGTLYYNQRESIYPTHRVVAVDLRTGEERWTRELKTPDGTVCSLSFGQAFYWDSYNYHGTFYFLWSTVGNKWHAFDATTGDWIYTIENMPAGSATYGSNVYGDKGEIYIYTVDTANGWMTLWNSSRVVSNEGSFTPHGKIYNYSKGIEWNVTIPKNLPGAAALYYYKDRVIGMNGTSFGRQFMDCVTNWAIDVSPGREGQLLWKENYVPMDEAVIMRTVGLGDPETRVFARYCQTTRQWIGFDMDTGKNIWVSEPMESFDYFTFGTVWDGKLYDVAYGGVLFCFDFKTGETLWKHEIKDFYNENLFSNNWGSYSDMFIADGKVYIGSGEHSPIDPNYRGAPFTCIDAQTGEQIFRIDGFYNSYMQTGFLIGDSVVAMMNTYDLQVYAFGKGPSATTVTVNDDVITQGNKVLITGTVMDVSPGTKAANRLLRFPNGVPAVDDASTSQWMQYVYQQIERPTNATGVTVELFVLDANGNYRSIGTTTTNTDGYYSYLWMPDIEGTYTVYASFAGSASYYPSHAVAAFAVDSVPATPTPVATPTASMADLYLVPGIIGIIIAMIAVGVVIILVLRKKP